MEAQQITNQKIIDWFSTQAGGGVPAVLNDGNTIAWYDYTKGVTKDVDNKVSQWNDQSGNDNHLEQSNTDRQPLYQSTGILFDGVDDNMFKAFTYNQPVQIYFCFRNKNWSNGRYITDGVSSIVMLTTRATTPGIKAYAGGSFSTQDDNLPIDEYGVIRVLYNGASSKLIVNDNTPIEDNFGANNPGGITIGSKYNDISVATNIEVAEMICRTIADTEEDSLAIYNYLQAKSVTLNSVSVPTMNMSVTLGATTTLSNFLQLTVDNGGYVYVDFGDGVTQKVIADGTEKNIVKTYPAGNTTYDVKIYGELEKLKKFSSSETAIWNIDVTEFEKASNIESIGISGGRARTLAGTITNLTSLKEWWFHYPSIPNLTGIQGNINNLTNLEILEAQGMPGNYHLANVTGDFANIPNLKQHCAAHKITGDISTLTNMEYFSWGYVVGGVDGSIQGDNSAIRITGDISDMVNLWYWAHNGGADSITGETTLLVNAEYFTIPGAVTKPATIAHMPKLSVLTTPPDWVLSEAEVNQYLADIWANREVVRTYLKNTVGTTYGAGFRDINLSTNASSSAPTGQGLIDKSNLQSTVSPADPGNGVVWTVDTN
jgi:hypothetical protein